jgi:hypothetical protein
VCICHISCRKEGTWFPAINEKFKKVKFDRGQVKDGSITKVCGVSARYVPMTHLLEGRIFMSKLVGIVFLLMGLLGFQSAYGMTGDHGCGLYQLVGIVETNADDRYVYIVNKGSYSQFTITIPIDLEAHLAPYLLSGRTSKITARFTKKIEGFRGEFANIESTERSMPDPLGLLNQSTFMLISEEKCGK